MYSYPAASRLIGAAGTKFTDGSDEGFKSEGVEAIRLPFRAPRANSYSERWVGSARREVLDRVLIFGRRHVEEILTEFIVISSFSVVVLVEQATKTKTALDRAANARPVSQHIVRPRSAWRFTPRVLASRSIELTEAGLLHKLPRSRAAIYVRISSDPKHDGLGVKRQERECRELCRPSSSLWSPSSLDDDRSAFSGKPRPGYLGMLERLQLSDF